LTVAAPQAAGVFGFAGKEKVTAGPLTLTLDGPGEFATLLVTALDSKPLRQSTRILVSVPGSTVREGQKLVNYPGSTDWWTLTPDTRVPDKPSGLFSGAGPVRMERVPCVITIESTAKSLAVYPLDGAGNRMAPLAGPEVKKVGKTFRIHLASDAPWYEIAGESRLKLSGGLGRVGPRPAQRK